MNIAIGTLLLAGSGYVIIWYALTLLGIAMADYFKGVKEAPPSVWYLIVAGTIAVLSLMLFIP